MTRRLAAIALIVLSMSIAFGSRPSQAGSRAHVYLFRGLADVFSTGMDVLTDELNRRGVYATSHSHTEWRALADQAAADYKAGKEGPIILIGHSLGADAVMEMADYLGDKGVPVALVIPFDGTQSFLASANISHVVNFTQRDYAYMRKGPGFRGTLVNVDLSADPDIGHLNIDKSPQLHARAIKEVLAVAAGHTGLPVAEKPAATPPGMPHRDSEEQRERTAPEPAAAETAKGSAPNSPRPLAPSLAPSLAPPLPPPSAPIKPETSVSSPAYIQSQAPAAPVSPGYASPGFPPQPPPPRLAPVRPLDIPD